MAKKTAKKKPRPRRKGAFGRALRGAGRHLGRELAAFTTNVAQIGWAAVTRLFEVFT